MSTVNLTTDQKRLIREYNPALKMAELDTILQEIADAINGGTGIPHSGLSGLTTTDAGHTQFVMRDGSKAMTGDLPMGTRKLTGLGNGTTATQDSCTVAQMEAAVAAMSVGLDWMTPEAKCLALRTTLAGIGYTAAASTLTATGVGAFPVTDGVTLLLGESVLVAEPGSVAHIDHGVYTMTTLGDGATAWVLTRRSDMAVGADAAAKTISVDQGTTYGETVQRVSTAKGSAVVGTNALVFDDFALAVDHYMLRHRGVQTHAEIDTHMGEQKWLAPVRAFIDRTALNAARPFTRTGDVITETVPNSGLPVQDGVTLANGQLVVLAELALAAHADNGIYVVTDIGDGTHPYILTRRWDMAAASVAAGATVQILEGTTYGDTYWRIRENAAAAVVNTHALTWMRMEGVLAHQELAGAGTMTHPNIDDRLTAMPLSTVARAFVDRSALAIAAAYTRVANVITENAVGAIPVQDGVTLVDGDIVLLGELAGAAHADCGLYVVTEAGDGATAYILTRLWSMTGGQAASGHGVIVAEGTSYKGVYTCTNPAATDTVNTDALGFSDLSGYIDHTQVENRGTLAHASLDLIALRLGGGLNKVRVIVDRTALPAYTYVAGVITENVPAVGLPNQDGQVMVAGDYVLVCDPTAGAPHANDGFYTITDLGDGTHPFILTRVAWMAHGQTDTGSALCRVYAGATYQGLWAMADAAIVIGTGTQTWVRLENVVNHLILQNIQGGSATEQYHFTQAQHTALLAYAHFMGTFATSNPPTAAEAAAVLLADGDFGFGTNAGNEFLILRVAGPAYRYWTMTGTCV